MHVYYYPPHRLVRALCRIWALSGSSRHQMSCGLSWVWPCGSSKTCGQQVSALSGLPLWLCFAAYKIATPPAHL